MATGSIIRVICDDVNFRGLLLPWPNPYSRAMKNLSSKQIENYQFIYVDC
jgi:hypothetical protein